MFVTCQTLSCQGVTGVLTVAAVLWCRRWASSHSPYQPFMAGYFVRLLMAVLLTTLARAFPPGESPAASTCRTSDCARCSSASAVCSDWASMAARACTEGAQQQW